MTDAAGGGPLPSAHSHLDKAIAVGLLMAVAFTALAYGTVEAWSVAIFEMIVVALILLWAFKSAADKRLKIVIPTASLPVAALFALGLAQSVAVTDSAGRRSSLSLDVEATRAAVVVLFFLLVSSIIAANFFATRDRLRLLANFLVIFGFVMAVFALMQHFAGNGRIYWLRPTNRSVFGPFVNNNHFAGYMDMLIPVAVAVVITRVVRGEARLFYGFAAAMMGVATFVSLSRGGMVSLAAGLMFIVLMSTLLKKKGEAGAKSNSLLTILTRSGAVVAITLAIIVGVIWVGAGAVINRAVFRTVDQMASSDPQLHLGGRGWIWKDTLEMVRANPLLGVGLGAYETAYPIYGHRYRRHVVDYAHNDYLQILADGGIIGGLIALWFIALIFRAIVRGTKSDDPLRAGLALGCGAGVFSILVHSLFDFNLQIPSNALLFLFFSAVVSQIGSSAIAGDSRAAQPYAIQTGAAGFMERVRS